MKRILVLADVERGRLDDSARELLGAARALAGDDGRTAAVVLGEGVAGIAEELARGYDEVFVLDDPRLADPDGEGDALALAPLVEREPCDVLLLAHTNRAIDLAPALSVRLGRPLLGDCLALAWRGDELTAVRTVYGGRVHARVVAHATGRGFLATVRGGAFPAAELAGASGAIHGEGLPTDWLPRRRAVRTVAPEAGAVDLTQAPVLVGVGRGLEDAENLELAEALADAVGGELCCSRPVVDKGWLPRSRQVGTSGVTVHPRLYFALGISGSFQHVGGIKGAPYMVAINKDPGAPIFGVADVGIVGDLCEVVPALEEEIRKAKG